MEPNKKENEINEIEKIEEIEETIIVENCENSDNAETEIGEILPEKEESTEEIETIEITEEETEVKEKPKEKITLKSILTEWLLPICFDISIVLLIHFTIAFVTVVPTGSMLPTVPLNSWHIATRMYFPEKTIARGDIIIFKSEEMDTILFKRCIGLPGEQIDIMENGDIYVGGVLLEEKYVVNQVDKCERQTFNVPDDHYFFLGDNRSGSVDARYWKNPYIHKDSLIGEARFTFFPFSHFGVLK